MTGRLPGVRASEGGPRRFVLLMVAALLLATPPSAGRAVGATQGTAPASEELASVDDWLATQREELGFPGMAVAVVVEGEVALLRGYGVTGIDGQEPVTAETPFPVASLGKGMTALTVGTLIDDDLLELDEPVSRHLPELGSAGDAVTIADLMHHRSGLDRSADFDGRAARLLDAPASVLPTLRDGLSPGAGLDYANVNYDLLGLIVQRVTGVAFEEAMDERLFVPLGMVQASATPGARAQPTVATEHYHVPVVGYRPLSGQPPAGTAASFGMTASVSDMVRVLQVQLGIPVADEELFGSEVRDALQTPVVEEESSFGYAGGVWVQLAGAPGMPDELGETSVIWHGGVTFGARAELVALPELGAGVVLVANANDVVDESYLGQIAWGTVRQLAGLAPDPVGSRSSWLTRWSKHLMLCVVVLQVAGGVWFVVSWRRLQRSRPWSTAQRTLLVALTTVDVFAAALLLVIVPAEGGVPAAYLANAPDYRFLLGGMALGVVWGLGRTVAVTVRTVRRRAAPS